MWIIKNSDGTPARVVTDEMDVMEDGQKRVAASASEIVESMLVIAAAIAKETRAASRMARYQAESDPLFFKAQRGEVTLDEWNAKVAEIKAAIC